MLLILSGQMWPVGYNGCWIGVFFNYRHELFVITKTGAKNEGIGDLKPIPEYLNQP